MSEIDIYIGARLREAREDAGLTRAELAGSLGHDLDWLASAEEGATPLAGRDLWLLSMVLHTSVSHFFPGVRDADLNDSERALLELFRELNTGWQADVIESLRSQVQLMRDSRAIDTMPERERQQARYRAVARYLLDNGARVTLGPHGRPVFEDADISAILQAMPESERTQVAEAAWSLIREGREAEERERAERPVDVDPNEPIEDQEDSY